MALDIILKASSHYFDQLVNLIPSKFYLENDSEKLSTKYMKKNAKAQAKQQMKEQYKKNKRSKLDPEQAATTVELQKQIAQGEKAPVLKPETATPEMIAAQINFSASNRPTRQELQERLQKKIEEVRGQRKDKKEDKKPADKKQVAAKAKEWKQKMLAQNAEQQKQKQQQQQQQLQKRKLDEPVDKVPASKKQRTEPTSEGGLAFNKIQVGEERKSHKDKKGKKATTADLLAAAEAKRKELEKLGASQEGKAKVQQVAWGSALQRAGGEKVLDNPKLLRKRLKRENKTKEKSAKKWQERLGYQKQQQDKKQDKRKSNMDARVSAKQEKKKEKREKKLLRAGFEGRRTDFIGK